MNLIVKCCWNDTDRGKAERLEKNLFHSHICYMSRWTELWTNWSLCLDRWSSNCFGLGTLINGRYLFDRRLKINFVRHAKYTFFVTETDSWHISRAVRAVNIAKRIQTYFWDCKVQSFHITATGACTDQHLMFVCPCIANTSITVNDDQQDANIFDLNW